MKALALLSALALTLLTGCVSFTPSQSAVFVDEDGRLVGVEYGQTKKPHASKFVAPNTGKTLEMKSSLAVRVIMPDGDDFFAWQCMNMERTGTMYRTDDEEWYFHANGVSCAVYRKDADGRYPLVFEGVICRTPQRK